MGLSKPQSRHIAHGNVLAFHAHFIRLQVYLAHGFFAKMLVGREALEEEKAKAMTLPGNPGDSQSGCFDIPDVILYTFAVYRVFLDVL